MTKIVFALLQEDTVTNKTVKITANVQVSVDGKEITNDNLDDKVLEALKVIVNGQWSFTNPTRTVDTFKRESAHFTAVTRVDMTENFSLQDRAKKASSEQIIIMVSSVDTSVPTRDIQEAVSGLRVKMLLKAQEEAKRLSEGGAQKFAIKAIKFAENVRLDVSNNLKGASSTYAAASLNEGGSGGSIGHSQKITLEAEVTLASAKA